LSLCSDIEGARGGGVVAFGFKDPSQGHLIASLISPVSFFHEFFTPYPVLLANRKVGMDPLDDPAI
jgi:hypothetical protein